MTRPVNVYEWQRAEGQTYYEKVFVCGGEFHQFGSDYEEFENGAASFSTAIVELKDGTVVNIQAQLVVFTDRPSTEQPIEQ